jgi:hypothetical protein
MNEYWNEDLIFDSELIWINIHLPLSCDKGTFQNVLAISGLIYSQKFN